MKIESFAWRFHINIFVPNPLEKNAIIDPLGGNQTCARDILVRRFKLLVSKETWITQPVKTITLVKRCWQPDLIPEALKFITRQPRIVSTSKALPL